MPLNDKFIKSLLPEEKSKKYFDGGGLYLEVSPRGGKWWRLKYRLHGKEKRVSLGVYPDVSLKQAREKATDIKKSLKEGIDPSIQKKRVYAAKGNTFEVIAQEWVSSHSSVLTSKTVANTKSKLERFVYPMIGNIPINEITPPEILHLIRRVEATGAIYSAHATLGICSRIFRYGVACGNVESDPCRDLKGALKPYRTRSMSAFTRPEDIKRLLSAISVYNGNFITVCALKIAVLLFVRPGELRSAEWKEINLDKAEWRIPARKMKMREEHLVPLPKQALTILHELKAVTGDGKYLFPSRRTPQRCMSDNAILSALRYMGFDKEEIVGHGFRAMASSILNEQGWSPDIIERQLAHAERNKVRSAYNRALYMKDRRRMMQAWADYLDELLIE